VRFLSLQRACARVECQISHLAPYALGPLLIAVLVLVGRKSANRTLIALSAGAFVVMLLGVVLYGYVFGWTYAYAQPETGDLMRLNMWPISNAILATGKMMLLTSGIFGLFIAARHSRWLWFGAILLGLFAGVVANYSLYDTYLVGLVNARYLEAMLDYR
jgi:hypothetical protein